MGVVDGNNGTCHLRIIGHTQVIAPLAASELLVGLCLCMMSVPLSCCIFLHCLEPLCLLLCVCVCFHCASGGCTAWFGFLLHMYALLLIPCFASVHTLCTALLLCADIHARLSGFSVWDFGQSCMH